MKSLALLFLVMAIVMITVGYKEKQNKTEENKVIEYRYLPQNMLDEQILGQNLDKNFTNMFRKDDPYLVNALEDQEEEEEDLS